MEKRIICFRRCSVSALIRVFRSSLGQVVGVEHRTPTGAA